MEDKHQRSIAKAFTWRVIATLTTTIIVYVLTGSFVLAAEAGIIDITVKLAFYYFHERAWNRVRWGKR